jgi:hypothetical protein
VLSFSIKRGTNHGAKRGDPFEAHPAAKDAIEHAYGTLDQYFESLKNNLKSVPTGGADLGETFKECTNKNITLVQGFLKSLSNAKDFRDVVRVQTEFMHSQLNAFGEQAKNFAEAFGVSSQHRQ